MKELISEKLLLLIAELIDYDYRCFSWQGALSIPGGPRFSKYRILMEEYLVNKKKRQKIYNALATLKRSQYLQKKVFDKSCGYILTDKGIRRACQLRLKYIKKKKLPEGEYLLVFFDIPETKRRDRAELRSGLKNLGFEKIQKSVWASSFDVLKELKDLIATANLEQYVKSLLVKEMK